MLIKVHLRTSNVGRP